MKIDLQNPDPYFRHREYNPDTVGGAIIVVGIITVLLMIMMA